MIITKLSLADYLASDAGSYEGFEGGCEFVNGEIIEMPPESTQNALISLFLLQQFLQVVPFHWLRRMETEIVVAGRVRLPDFLVLGEELAVALEGSSRSTITEAMPAPLLVVEVVSPGKVNEDRDYRYKRSEYAARGIETYWIVDPAKQMVTVLTLVDGLYEAQEFVDNEVLSWQEFSGEGSEQSRIFSVSVSNLLCPKGG
ncbi:MAG: Uma2 family endonuclease [Cyanobacteria bacterium J06642_11]